MHPLTLVQWLGNYGENSGQVFLRRHFHRARKERYIMDVSSHDALEWDFVRDCLLYIGNGMMERRAERWGWMWEEGRVYIRAISTGVN